jgi:hypothetical protein
MSFARKETKEGATAWATAEWVLSKRDPQVKGTPGVGVGGLGGGAGVV